MRTRKISTEVEFPKEVERNRRRDVCACKEPGLRGVMEKDREVAVKITIYGEK